MKTWRSVAKALARSAGIEIRRLSPTLSSADADEVTRQLVGNISKPVIFDVGANEGQSVRRFKRMFPNCEIHAFEPSPTTFRKLSAETADFSDVHLNQCGVGDESGVLHLKENSDSTMTSFLSPGPGCWGEIDRTTQVPVTTLDRYCDEQEIPFIDLLKTDTQGFDFQVASGATSLLGSKRIHAIKTELIFTDLYENQVQAEDYHKRLRGAGFQLVGYYDFGFQNGLLGWCDALFVNHGARRPNASG